MYFVAIFLIFFLLCLFYMFFFFTDDFSFLYIYCLWYRCFFSFLNFNFGIAILHFVNQRTRFLFIIKCGSLFYLVVDQLQCLMVIGRDGGSSTLCHRCEFACQQRVLRTFPCPGFYAPVMGII